MIKGVLDKINPTHLFYMIYALLLAIWIIPYYVEDILIKLILSGIFGLISAIFIGEIISIIFTRENIIKRITESFKGKPVEAVNYLRNETESWLNYVLKFITKLEKHHKIKSIDIDLKESKLQLIFSKTSESICADREAIEKLIGISADIDPRIVREIIAGDDAVKLKRGKEKLERKLNRLNKLKEKADFIPDIVDIIRDASTGRAVTKSADVLQKASDVEDLKWLIRFVNSRIGFRMSELLGLKVEWGIVKWYEKEVVEISTEQDYIQLFSNKNFKLAEASALALFKKFRIIYDINNVDITLLKNTIGDDSANIVSNKAKNMVDFDDVKKFLENFKSKRKFALDHIWNNFLNWHRVDIKKDIFDAEQPLAIALTFGYSKILEFLLDKMLVNAKQMGEDIKRMQLILIKSEQKFGDEEFLRAELIGKHSELNCSIMPLAAIRERGLRIGKVFVGIESIDISGDIVHPRGSVEGIKEIKDFAPNASFYAFGETYKVKQFNKILIDYTKLAFSKHEYINYVITDHGIHRLNKGTWESFDGKNWKLTDGTLYCCINHWQEIIRKEIDESHDKRNKEQV